ncbi:MAG: phosphoribosylaminoimidazolesuccinocarboxamide synthase [Candidatus Hodarchaeota archaeon]
MSEYPSLGNPIREGKTKIVYESDNPDEVVLKFKNDITALDGEKHDIIAGKGYINAYISSRLFELLESSGVPTHYKTYIGPNLMVARKVQMLPVEVVCRNIAAGHLLKRLPIAEGTRLEIPVVEFFYKSDELHDPMLNDYHMRLLGLANTREIREMEKITLNVNRVLTEFLEKRGLSLVDFKIEFGRDKDNNLLVGDEINADSMRVWKESGEILDKDVYRKGGTLEQVLQTYVSYFKTILGEEPDPEALKS